MKKTLLFKSFALSLFMLLSIGILNAQVFISQNADPRNNYAADRFAEIYNPTASSVDLTGWTLENVQGGTVQFTWTLSGNIASGEALICGNADATGQTITPDFTATWVGNSFNGKGGDGTILKNAAGTVVDNAVQVDATGMFENAQMVRNSNITAPSASYDATQWTFSAVDDAVDATPGEHTCDLPVMSFDVTFNVDMNGVSSFVAGTDKVYIAGDIAGGWIAPGDNAAYEMMDTDADGIYTITLTKDPEGDIAYKFFINAGWDGGEWTGGDNRTANISEETTLNAVFGYYIYDVAVAAAPFYAGDEVTFTWKSYGPTDVKIEAWIPDNAAWSELFSTTTNDGTEPFTVPAEAWYSDEYKVRISDASNADVFGLSDDFEIIATPTIFDIQATTSDNDLSEYDGQKVRVSGIVTAISGSNFWIQMAPAKDSQYPEWSGIFGYDATLAGAVAIGDDVTLEATIDEYYNATEIVNVTSLTINSSDNTISPVAVTAANAIEPYESTLITIMNAEVKSDPDSYGEFIINDGTGDYTVDDKIFAYTPTIGEFIDVSGVTTYSYGAFKLYPRSADDVVVASGVGIDDLSSTAMSIYPNPSHGKFYLQMGDAFEANTKIEVFNVVGMKVFETLSTNLKTEIDLSDMKQGVYYIRVDDGQNIITQKVMKR